jgi:predicted RNase H-like HicB family nuclease
LALKNKGNGTISRYCKTREIGDPNNKYRVKTRYTYHIDFHVELEQESDGRWITESSELPGVLVYGDTRENATRKAQVLALSVVADELEQEIERSAIVLNLLAKYNFPIFEKVSEPLFDPKKLVGHVNKINYGVEEWIGNNYMGYLVSEERFVEGRWTSQGDQWVFALENSEDSEFCETVSTFYVFDGYWGEKTEFVLNRLRVWEKRIFQASNGLLIGRVLTPTDLTSTETGEIIQNGWDHEHCVMYGEKIGRGGDPIGYFSAPNTWVCQTCFSSFVEPRSLDFIPKPE